MDVLVVAGGHYFRKKDGTVYVESLFDYAFYSRYLGVFDNVYAVARIKETDIIPATAKLVSGERLHFLPIPETQGPREYLFNRKKTVNLIRKYIQQFDCAIFRISESTAHLVCKEYIKTGKDFALEIIVDPWEFFSPGTVKSITRPFIRVLWTIEMKKVCKKAKGVSYVTEKYLQKKYPCKGLKGVDGYFTAYYSSVELPDDSYGYPREYLKKDKYSIVHVSNAFTGYGKGQIETMQVLREILVHGYDVEVRFVGDGPLMGKFQRYAKEAGVDKKCVFLGRLPDSTEVRKVIRGSDLMIFPTRGEGLPRVVLEAMAEGLPVISTPVCGIPEIIENDMLFQPSDIRGMADRAVYLFDNPEEMSRISEHNIRKAYEYRKSRLQETRNKYYQKVRIMGEGNLENKDMQTN